LGRIRVCYSCGLDTAKRWFLNRGTDYDLCGRCYDYITRTPKYNSKSERYADHSKRMKEWNRIHGSPTKGRSVYNGIRYCISCGVTSYKVGRRRYEQWCYNRDLKTNEIINMLCYRCYSGLYLDYNPTTKSTLRKETIIKIGNALRGRTYPHLSGSNSHTWKGGISPLRASIMHCDSYRKWRSLVFERDNYVCQNPRCAKVSGDKHAHHIIPFDSIVKKYNINTLYEAINCPELWDIDNGITLCVKCHRKTF